MQSYNSQETTIFFYEKPKFVARRRSERKHSPRRRYYGGNEIIDQIENTCKTRALRAFGVSGNS